MLVNEANFVSEVATLVHNWQRFPLACLDVNLFNIGREATAEAASEDNHSVRLRTKASAVAERELQLDLQTLPVAVLDTVAFYCIEAVLAVITTEGIYELVVDDSR